MILKLILKTTRALLKKRMPNIDVNSVEKKVNNERTEKTLSGKKRILIVEESVMKHVNGYEICKFFADSKFTDSQFARTDAMYIIPNWGRRSVA